MNDHIPDATKMIGTPRMHSALIDAPEAGFAKIWQVGCDIERELTTAQQRIKELVEELNELRSDEAGLLKYNEELERRINRLDEYIHNLQKLGDSMALGRNPFIQNAWDAAKEAKP
jgi:predicted nuclease with TOPRIM domain